MTDSPSQQAAAKRHRNRWLILIAIFKLAQATLFILIGVGALRLVHKDVGDILQNLVDHLRFNPESQLVIFVLHKALLVDDHLLRQISAVVFIYAGLGIVEGTGLYLEKAWAEYMTLFITASFLPWEVFEVIRKTTLIRGGLLVINTLVFFYLLKIVVDRVKRPNDKAISSQ